MECGSEMGIIMYHPAGAIKDCLEYGVVQGWPSLRCTGRHGQGGVTGRSNGYSQPGGGLAVTNDVFGLFMPVHVSFPRFPTVNNDGLGENWRALRQKL